MSNDRPFQSLGEQLIAIREAAQPAGAGPHPGLLHLNEAHAKIQGAASGASTTVGSDGGFVIQTDFAEGITTKMWEEGQVLSRTNHVPISANSNALVRHQLKETSRKTGNRYGGVRVYRTAEADTVAQSKPSVRPQRTELEKLMGIFYATEETLEDAMALTAMAETAFRRELTFVAENEVFRGGGVGECLGFLNSNALVVVPKEAGQTAATVNVNNVANMLARLPASSFRTAGWYHHPSVLPQLVTMTVGNQPVFLPGNGLAGTPFGTLFGLPLFPVEYCATLGSQDDICLVDLQQYTTIDKRGPTWQESIHVRFIWDETTFKLTYRFNGQPDWESSVEPFQGADNISPFITLAERA